MHPTTVIARITMVNGQIQIRVLSEPKSYSRSALQNESKRCVRSDD
jgi:hypothetical protein